MKRHQRIFPQGFTLIELAIALSIVAFIIGGLAIPLSTRLVEQQYVDTQASVDKAVEALIGLAARTGRLPCPDMRTAGAADDNRDGLEDRAILPAVGCDAGFGGTNNDAGNASWGDLPWQTLGLQAPNNQDAWNNRLRYAVYEPLTHAAPVFPANLGAAAMLDLRCGNPPTLPPAVRAAFVPAPGCLAVPAGNPYQLTATAVFVVYSVGANGWGGTNINDVTTARPFTAVQIALTPDQAANAPENEAGAAAANIALRRQFVTRARSDAVSNAGEYDDVLAYMSSNLFAAKMMAAGVWP